MFRLNINSQKHGLVFLDFSSQIEIDEYIAKNEESGHWGKLAYVEIIPAVDAIFDENGVEINSATPEQVIQHPATVSYDVTVSPVVQENINKEALKYLADTDWYILREIDAGIPCPTEIKTLRAQARLRIV